MFNKINGNSYTLSSEYADKIVSQCKEVLEEYDSGVEIELIIYQMSVRRLVAYRIAMLAITNIKESVIKNGFVAITYNSDVSGIVSVGWVDDKLVYDDLIK